MRIVNGDEFDAAVHHGGNEGHVARQPVELGDHELGLVLAAGGQRSGELRPIAVLAGFHLDEFGRQRPLPAIEIIGHGLALRFEPETGFTLPVGRDPQIRHPLPAVRLRLWHDFPHDLEPSYQRMMISQRTKAALAAAKARGKKLGGPKLAVATKLGNAANAAAADRFAANVVPIIRQIRATGAASLRAVAVALTARGIATARGGEWNAAQVANVLKREQL